MKSRFAYRIDTAIGSWIEKIPEPTRPFLVWVSTVTHPVVWACVLLGASGGAIIIGSTQVGLLYFAVAALLPLEQVLKRIFRRPRPKTMYVDAMKFRSYSFPSGHAYASVLFFGMVTLTMQLMAGVVAGSLAGVVAGIAILLIGISRVYMGAHFPTDVIAGWVIGTGLFLSLCVYAINSDIITLLS